MPEKDVLHIRFSKDIALKFENLIDEGLFGNKNEIIREAIRNVIMKYKDEVKTKK